MRKTRQNHQNPGMSQKLKVPKWVCRSPLANFCNGPPFSAIFGRASGQIYQKISKNSKTSIKNCLFWAFGDSIRDFEEMKLLSINMQGCCQAHSFCNTITSNWPQIQILPLPLYKKPQEAIFPSFFHHFFGRFSIYLAASAAKYREKGRGRYKNWRGVIDKPILALLTFGSNPDFSDVGVFCACFAHVLRMFCVFCACFAHVFGIFGSQGRLR